MLLEMGVTDLTALGRMVKEWTVDELRAAVVKRAMEENFMLFPVVFY